MLQLTDRQLSLGGNDANAIKKDKKIAARKERVEAQKRKHEETQKAEEEQQQNALQELTNLLGEDERDDGADDDGDPTFSPPTSRRRLDPAPPLYVPRNILLRPEVQACLIRNKISPHAGVDLIASIIAASGGKISDYCLNASYVGKQNNKMARETLEEDREAWIPPEVPVGLQ